MPRPGIAVSMLVFVGAWSVAARGGEAPSVAIEQAIADAKAAGHPLVLEFWTTWCEPCKTFVSDVLPDAGVQERLRGFSFVRYDAEAQPGLAAATRYRVNSYPTFIAVDADGKERHRSSGLGSTGAFIRFLDDAETLVKDEAAIRASGPRARAPRSLGPRHGRRGLRRDRRSRRGAPPRGPGDRLRQGRDPPPSPPGRPGAVRQGR